VGQSRRLTSDGKSLNTEVMSVEARRTQEDEHGYTG